MADDWIQKCLKMAQGDQTPILEPDQELEQGNPLDQHKQASGVEVGILRGQVVLVLHQPPLPPLMIPLKPETAQTTGRALIQAAMIATIGTSFRGGTSSPDGSEDSGPDPVS